MKQYHDLQKILSFFDFPQRKNFLFQVIENGRIHDSYFVSDSDSGEKILILQKLNTDVFNDIDDLMNRYVKISIYLEKNGFIAPKLILTKTKSPFLYLNNEYWRLLIYIKHNASFSNTPNSTVANEAGKILAKFHSLFLLNKESLCPPQKSFFHSPYDYFHVLKNKVAANKTENTKKIEYFFDKWENRLVDFKTVSKYPLYVCHNDPKLSNILFNSKYRSICLIDLDTTGLSILPFDFGDAVRSVCSRLENSQEHPLKFDHDYFQNFCEGYFSLLDTKLAISYETDLWIEGIKAIIIELSIRYYLDYYFQENRKLKTGSKEHSYKKALDLQYFLEDFERQENDAILTLKQTLMKHKR